MKRIFMLICILAICHKETNAQNDNPDYDQKLAEQLNADEHGMRQYYLVILKSGSNKGEDKAKQEAFGGHMKNIGRLAKEGKLAVAGPMGKNDKEYRGLFILAVATKEEAESLVQTDPAVIGKYLDYELYPWYGSAALPKHLEYHKKIEKKKH